MNVEEFLDAQDVPYEVIAHEQAYTAQEVAATEHVTGHIFAKTVIVMAGGDPYMMVLPASRQVDLEAAADLIGEPVRLAEESEMKDLFPDVDVGAEPPFGSEYDMETFVDESLADQEDIVFRAGTHRRTIKMAFADYESIEHPELADFSTDVI